MISTTKLNGMFLFLPEQLGCAITGIAQYSKLSLIVQYTKVESICLYKV